MKLCNKSYGKINDIQSAVLEELKWEPLLHADHIGVFVRAGEVILSGCVDKYRKSLLRNKLCIG